MDLLLYHQQTVCLYIYSFGSWELNNDEVYSSLFVPCFVLLQFLIKNLHFVHWFLIVRAWPDVGLHDVKNGKGNY